MAEKKTKPNGPGRKQMLILWTAALTALGSTGIPRIVELLETKPSVEQVQGMIAEQTTLIAVQVKRLTVAYNEAVGVLRLVERRLDDLEHRRRFSARFSPPMRRSGSKRPESRSVLKPEPIMESEPESEPELESVSKPELEPKPKLVSKPEPGTGPVEAVMMDMLGGDEEPNAVNRVPDFPCQTVQMQLQLALPAPEKE